MTATIIYIVILTLVFLVFVITSALLILGILSLFRSPHRSKLFFSYSHKDSEIAKDILKRLNIYRFKIWIDLGIEIPTDRLEKELSEAVEGCEIFILLASRNSQGSNWVQFEIDQAKKMPELPEHRARSLTERLTEPPKGLFRDTIILSLDDWGLPVYEKIKEHNKDLLLDYGLLDWDELKDEWAEIREELPQAVRVIANTYGKGMQGLVNPQPSMKRVFKPTITLFDLSRSFEPVMQQLAEYLRNTTQLLRSQSQEVKVTKLIVLLFYTLAMLSSGFVLLLLLFGIKK